MDDTIVAISSATGPAPRMILRLTGLQTSTIAANLQINFPNKTSTATRQPLSFLGIHCPAWIYCFVTPNSYTGEDLIELHIPGNPLLARLILDHIVTQGARVAEPGEFTARAYFNGKLDLSQAEGIVAAIAAQNQRQLASARQLMAGELANRLRPIMDTLGESLALIEAGIDFSDEGIQFIFPAEAAARIDTMLQQLQSLIAQSARFEKLTHEPTIVLAGRPNAGKSTLTNALAGRGRSIVSPMPGTTRDALSAEMILDRGVVRLIDIAGLETSASENEIEKQMQQLAHRAIEQSDVLVLVHDATDSRPDVSLPRRPDLRISSKSDLLAKIPNDSDAQFVSAATGSGMDALRIILDRLAFGPETPDAGLSLTTRHLHSLNEAISALDRSRTHIQSAPELLAADLRAALDALGQILGIVTPDDILGKVFSKFCIGK